MVRNADHHLGRFDVETVLENLFPRVRDEVVFQCAFNEISGNAVFFDKAARKIKNLVDSEVKELPSRTVREFLFVSVTKSRRKRVRDK